jgi:PAS domain S-box-containing protein
MMMGSATPPDPALPPPSWAERLPAWAWLLLFAAADVALRRAGYLFADRPGSVATVWPSAGLTLYALLVSRRHTWPILLAVAVSVGVAESLQHGRTLTTAVAYNAGYLAQVVAAAWLMVRIGGRPTLRTLRGVLTLMLVPAAALAVVAAIAQVVVAASAPPVREEVFWVFWAANMLGIVFVTSLLVEWTTPSRPLVDGRGAWVAVAGIAAALAAAMFLLRTRDVMMNEVVLLPPLLWAALRFGPRGATATLTVAAVALFETSAAGHGHLGVAWSMAPGPAGALAFQIFLILGGASILAAAAVEEERRAAQERRVLLEHAFDHTPDPAGVLEEDGTVVWANEAWARLLGVPRDRLVGRHLWEVARGATREAWLERWRRVKASATVRAEEWVPGGDGRAVPWEVSDALAEMAGRPLLVSVYRDVSDRRRAEESSRLAALGTLAAGVAHEINNPLAYVIANLAHARDRAGALAGTEAGEGLRAEVVEPLADAEEGARRVHEIVRQLRAFARAEEAEGPVDPARALRAALAMAQNEIRQRARVVADVGPAPPVIGNENRLTQVFLNLLVNAAQAIPEGDVARNEVRAALRVEGDQIVAEVSDTGAGMTPETRARVFEPFYTTKGPGEGTGLGLAISHSIVAGMHGRIEIASEPGAGSRFRVILPIARAIPPGAREAPRQPTPAPARPRRLLIVDDEPLVSRALARLLEPEGEVVLVDRAREALERVRAGERFDVIVCDLMMPDLSGMALHAAVQELDPGIAARMVFVTGGAFTDAAREFLERVPNARLEKPIDRAALREAVRRIAPQ